MPTTHELLDSESWGEVLESYARSIDVAVALVDHDGHLIGKCHNAQPIWSLAREVRPEWGRGCLFCLNASGRCTAAADAERTRSVVLAWGLGGFVHVAAPLFLADRHLGTLLAGQVFVQYPELLLLEEVAREFGISGQKLWDIARRLVPVSHTNLTAYGNLLGTLGHAFLRERYSTVLKRDLAETNERLRSSNVDLLDANSKLSGKVEELAQSVAEKDILLNEVHHRVNNNLQVIASLLRMQAEGYPNDQVADALRETQLRVESMALIHAHLYNSADWNAVNFAEYTTVLVGNLFVSYGVDPALITGRVEISPFELSVDKAIPAGLILNELISNALKHAFPDGRHGSILVKGGLCDGRVQLVVEDDGTGVSGKTAERSRRQSLGLKIVEILGRQLKGTFEQPDAAREPGAGSIFRVSFPYRTTVSK